jgi:hypothetical protein
MSSSVFKTACSLRISVAFLPPQVAVALADALFLGRALPGARSCLGLGAIALGVNSRGRPSYSGHCHFQSR